MRPQGGGVTCIASVVHETRAPDSMLLVEMIEVSKSAQLVAFVGRIRQSMGKVENVHRSARQVS